MFFKKKIYQCEENARIPTYGNKITKKLEVFFNPEMKLNRDISLLVINSYFDKPIKFCDPMVASGIREIRFLKTISGKFKQLVLGDISKTAIKNAKRNFRENKVSLRKCKFFTQSAINTINSDYFEHLFRHC